MANGVANEWIGSRLVRLEDDIDRHEARLNAVEKDVAAIKAYLRLIGGAVIIGTPVITAILVKFVG